MKTTALILPIVSIVAINLPANALPHMGTNCPERFTQICLKSDGDFKPPEGSGTPRTAESGASRQPANPRKSLEKQVIKFSFDDEIEPIGAPETTASGATKEQKKPARKGKPKPKPKARCSCNHEIPIVSGGR